MFLSFASLRLRASALSIRGFNFVSDRARIPPSYFPVSHKRVVAESETSPGKPAAREGAINRAGIARGDSPLAVLTHQILLHDNLAFRG